MKRVETTPGRMLIGECLPKNHKAPFEIVNRLLTKKEIADVIDTVYRECGQKETVLFADAIMGLGFRHACMAGISFGKDDMVVPHEKEGLVDETRSLVKDFEQQYQDGLITQGEKYNKVVDAWAKCTDKVADEMMKEISARRADKSGRELDINSIYMMSHSGARGSPAQMKQLAGMRGLMAKPSGEIIETPIISNFKEGLHHPRGGLRNQRGHHPRGRHPGWRDRRAAVPAHSRPHGARRHRQSDYRRPLRQARRRDR